MNESNIQRLLDDLCVRLGFCLPPKIQKRLAKFPPKDAKLFTDAVIKAEGLKPEQVDLHIYREILSAATNMYKNDRLM